MRVGISFTPFETRADVIVRLAVRADGLEVERVDVAEGWTHDALVVLTEVALRTSRIGLGSSVVSMWGRTPATLAMAAAGLQRCSNGRFTLGIGAGSPPLAEGFHGLRWERPAARLRATVATVRALLEGERLPDAVPDARPLRLGVLPEQPVPIGVAALTPPSIRVAGDLADVWTPFLWARSRLAEGQALLREGGRPVATAVGVPVALGPDERTARDLAAWWLSTYSTRMGPLYPRLLAERFGMADGVRAVVAAAPELPAEAEQLAREVTLLGTYDEAADAARAWAAAGADTVNFVLPPGRPEEELEALVDVAGAVAAAAPAAA